MYARKKNPIVKENTPEPKNPSDKESSEEEETNSPTLESLVRNKWRVEEETTSEEVGNLDKCIGEKDDSEEEVSGEEDPGKDQAPLFFNVHDLEEEGKEEEHGFLFVWCKDSQ
ncbi:hypothetical protein KI387_012811, partial [Taxus chinensis]